MCLFLCSLQFPFEYLNPSTSHLFSAKWGQFRRGSARYASPLSLFLSFDCWLVENNLSWCSSAAWAAGTTRHLSSPLLSSISLLQTNSGSFYGLGERIRVNRSVMQEEAGSTSAFQPSAWITFANILLTQAKCGSQAQRWVGDYTVINTRHGYQLTQLTQLIVISIYTTNLPPSALWPTLFTIPPTCKNTFITCKGLSKSYPSMASGSKPMICDLHQIRYVSSLS